MIWIIMLAVLCVWFGYIYSKEPPEHGDQGPADWPDER